jgi:hypothetical protein
VEEGVGVEEGKREKEGWLSLLEKTTVKELSEKKKKRFDNN